MTGRSTSGWGIALCALAALAACTSDDLSRVSGELSVTQQLDFGAVALGRRKVDKLVLRNLGRAPMEVQAPVMDQPAPADFTLGKVNTKVLLSGEQVEIPVAFAPAAVGRRGVQVRIATDSSRSPNATIELWGEGVLGKADLDTQAIDFGKVAVQTIEVKTFTLTNSDSHPATVNIQAPAGDDADFFTTNPTGEVTVPPGQQVTVDVRFAPMRLGPHAANIPVQTCPSCGIDTIALTGEGIAAVLVANPGSLDFGFTEPNKTSLQGTTITNVGTATVKILEVRTGSETPADYAVQPLATAAPFDLATNQSFDIQVGFTPKTFDKKTGTLRIKYQDPSWAAPQDLVVPLGGTGGGPDIEVVPNPLNYPRTAVGLTVDKTVSIRNVGRDPAKPLQVGELTIQNGVEFSIVQNPFPKALQPGEGKNVTIRYAPLMAGDSEADLVIPSNDPDENPVIVHLHGSASELGPCSYDVVPTTLDFGTVPVGAHARLGFAIRNTGTETCAVANVRLTSGTAPQFAITPLSTRMVDPGKSLLVPVEFEPDAEKNYTGGVDFDVSSPTAPHGHVTLLARGLVPCIEVDPQSLDFGSVGLACQPPTRTVQVRNACSQTVNVSGSEIGTGASEAFSIDPAAAGPHVLAPGADMLIPVTYAPKQEGEDLAPLFITNDVTPSPLLVPLTGQAQLRPTNVDTFVIPPQNKVDFLFVIDNSGSFTEEQDALSRNFDAFIQAAIANGTDYHIAITTTGLTPYRGGWSDCPGGAFGGEAGRFFPTDNSRPRILTPQTPNVKAVFSQNVKVGICHWWEEGLEASRLALSPPLVDHADDPNTPDPNDGNLGFLRPDASLYVLYISDEDDSGSRDPNDYVQFLKGLKPGRPDLVSASAIIGLPSCPTAPSVGTRYMAVVNALGGMIGDVCASDWGGLLQTIGKDAFMAQTVFPLSQAPDGRDIKVRLNGNEVLPTASDGTPQWHYDPSIGQFGAVVFEEKNAPGPNATVEIEYPVPCPPAN